MCPSPSNLAPARCRRRLAVSGQLPTRRFTLLCIPCPGAPPKWPRAPASHLPIDSPYIAPWRAVSARSWHIRGLGCLCQRHVAKRYGCFVFGFLLVQPDVCRCVGCCAVGVCCCASPQAGMTRSACWGFFHPPLGGCCSSLCTAQNLLFFFFKHLSVPASGTELAVCQLVVQN